MTSQPLDMPEAHEEEEPMMMETPSTDRPKTSSAALASFAAAGLLLDPRGIRVRTDNRAGGIILNHSEAGVPVRTQAKVGGPILQHSEAGVPVRTQAKVGGPFLQHSEASSVRR